MRTFAFLAFGLMAQLTSISVAQSQQSCFYGDKLGGLGQMISTAQMHAMNGNRDTACNLGMAALEGYQNLLNDYANCMDDWQKSQIYQIQASAEGQVMSYC